MPQSYPSPHTPHTPHTLHTPHTPHTSHDCHVSNASVPTAQPSTLPASTLSRQNIWQGFKQLTPISLFVVVFGAAFGLAAIQVGLSNSATLSMSAFVFAGASQFATLELWGAQVPIFTVLITVFAINARHLLMGATLYPWLRPLPPWQRYGIMLVASDANWAMAMQTFHGHRSNKHGNKHDRTGLGILFGGGLAIWLFWLLGTALGVYFGQAIKDPASLGLDMVMGCFLFAMVLGENKTPATLLIWVVAAAASIMAFYFLPENSHVIVGALAGGLVGLLPFKPHTPPAPNEETNSCS